MGLARRHLRFGRAQQRNRQNDPPDRADQIGRPDAAQIPSGADDDRRDSGADPRKKAEAADIPDRKSTRLNSSHMSISYAVFCLKKKKKITITHDSSYSAVNLDLG